MKEKLVEDTPSPTTIQTRVVGIVFQRSGSYKKLFFENNTILRFQAVQNGLRGALEGEGAV